MHRGFPNNKSGHFPEMGLSRKISLGTLPIARSDAKSHLMQSGKNAERSIPAQNATCFLPDALVSVFSSL